MTSKYPELPVVVPKTTYISLEKTVHLLLENAKSECLARAVFAIMYAEASRTNDRFNFRSAGNSNYSGVQTDSGRWGFSNFNGRYRRIDSGNVNREFASFKNDSDFLIFMLNRIEKKGLDGCNADKWTAKYISSWWSPKEKAQYTKGTAKYNSKKSIFLSAIKRFEQFKKTYTGKKSKKFPMIIAGTLIAGSIFTIYSLYFNSNEKIKLF
jgi:hypothetical protein